MNHDQMVAALKEKSDRISAIFALQEKEGQGDTARPATEAEVGELRKLHSECSDLEKQIKDTNEYDGFVQAQKARAEFLKTPIDQLPLLGGVTLQSQKSVADRLFEHEGFMAYAKEGAGRSSPRVLIDGVSMKSLVTGLSSTSAGALIVNDRKPGFDYAGYLQPLGLDQVITQGETSSDLVEFVRITSLTNNAVETLEATATGNGSGAAGESGFELEVVQENVQGIPHWIPCTRRAIQDEGQTRTIIDQVLNYGLAARLQSQWLNGNGTSPNLKGIKNQTGCLTQSFSNNLFESIRKGKTKVQLSAVNSGGGATPNAIVMNPSDWETVELAQDNQYRYYGQGPFGVTAPRLWGLPVVLSEFQATGYALVGDFSLAIWWDRMQAAIYTSDSHADFFVRGLLAFYAELRGAFGVIRPQAFCHVDIAA